MSVDEPRSQYLMVNRAFLLACSLSAKVVDIIGVEVRTIERVSISRFVSLLWLVYHHDHAMLLLSSVKREVLMLL